MNIGIKLYVHGVPNGQDKWNVEESDCNYIESFYGVRKPSVPILMYAEVKKYGQTVYCYYTYFRDKVIDCNGRSGGYIALTLRINYYYTDIRNIYNLLDAAYNKFIIGPIVRIDNDVARFCISDFSQEKARLLDLEKELYNYLMQFSSNSDFVSLEDFKMNGQDQSVGVNILECNAQEIADRMKRNGSISVSSLFPSKNEQQIRRKMKENYEANCARLQEKVEEAHANAQQEIEAIKVKCNDLNEVVDSLQDDLNKAKYENTRLKDELAGLKQEKHNSRPLRDDLNKARNENTRLKDELAELTQKLELIKSEKYDELKSALDNKNNILNKIQALLNNPSSHKHPGENNNNDYGDSQKSYTGGDSDSTSDEESSVENKPKTGIMGCMRKFLIPIIALVIPIIVLVVLAGETVILLSLKDDLHRNGNDILEEVTDIVSDALTNGPDSAPTRNETGWGKNNSMKFFKTVFPTARIDIKELNGNTLSKGGIYTVSLVNVGDLSSDKIKWVSEDLEDNNKIKPEREGECVIHCLLKATNDTIISRTIKVK